MRRLLSALVLLAVAVPAAHAAPGAYDTSFGGAGSVAIARADGIDGLAVARATRVMWAEGRGALRPLRARRGVDRQRPLPQRGNLLGVLPDGTQLTRSVAAGSVSLRRHAFSGAALTRFGAAGRLDLATTDTVHAAARPDGHVVVARVVGGKAPTRLAAYTETGAPDPGFAPRELPDIVTAIAADAAGRILIGGHSADGKTLFVRRLRPDGGDDPSFTPSTTASASPFGVYELVVGPAPDGPIVATREYGDRIVLDATGRRTAQTTRLASIGYGEPVVAIDRAGRIAASDGTRVYLIDAKGRHARRIRSVVRRKGRPLEIETIAVDRRARIVVGGRIVLASHEEERETDCPGICREDEFETVTVVDRATGAIARIEGGHERVRIASRRLGPRVVVRCLAAADRRCRGSLSVRRGARRVLERRLSLAPGARASFAVPAAARRGARSLRAVARVHDASGELATAARTLRR